MKCPSAAPPLLLRQRRCTLRRRRDGKEFDRMDRIDSHPVAPVSCSSRPDRRIFRHGAGQSEYSWICGRAPLGCA
ncbi:MAG: hypothetical protein L6244_04675 [Candidatus Methanoperedenaceae archaeon]|nr:hypothetical protein [Candidatus Methanoperedenaceae archaeon]